MFSRPSDRRTIWRLEKALEVASRIAVTCHVKPDGDAIGSALALWHVLGHMGKKVDVITPDAPPLYLRFLPGFKEIVPFTTHRDYAMELLSEADMLFCLDFNAAYRVDRMEDALRESTAFKVMIDHHLEPEDFTDVTISSPNDSSTCMLLFKVLCQLGLRPLIDKPSASCIAAGMMTDTGNFSYNANDPEAYQVMAELLTCGVDKVAIWERLNVKSESQLRLTGYALSEKLRVIGDDVALIQLTQEELDRFGYHKGDLEGLVNVPLQIPAVQMSVLMHQEPGFVKVSMRSVGNVPVNKVCETYYGGGGHLNAAGGEFTGSMYEAADVLEKALPHYRDFFRKKTNM